MSRGHGRMITKFYKCPKCGHENRFRLRKWEFSCDSRKTHRHCKECNEEIHFTNYCPAYSHPMNSKKKNEKIKADNQKKKDAGIAFSCTVNCDK